MTKIDFSLYANEPSTPAHKQSKKEKELKMREFELERREQELDERYSRNKYYESLIIDMYLSLEFFTRYIQTQKLHRYEIFKKVEQADSILDKLRDYLETLILIKRDIQI